MVSIPDGYGSVAMIHGERGADVGTEPYIWTFGIVATDASDALTKINAIVVAWNDNLAPITSNDFPLETVTCTIPDGTGGTGVITATTTPVEPSGGIDPAATALALKVRKLTARVGRHGRGLMHPPGMLDVTAVFGDGSIQASVITSISGGFASLATDLDAADVSMVLLHGDPGLDPDPVVALEVMDHVGVMRHRLLK